MKLDADGVLKLATSMGFRPDYVEKSLWLLELIDSLMKHPALKGKLALKGGTALNLFLFELPRLSIDIDINYIGSPDRPGMLEDKERIEPAIEGICHRLGITIRRRPAGHSGGKWSLKYPSRITAGGNLDLDLNYLLRVPLWPTAQMSSLPFGEIQCRNVTVLDIHELAAGKLAALFARHAPRDVFDTFLLLRDPRIDREKLRRGFVVYGAMSRRDWRTIEIGELDDSMERFEQEVSVLLRSGDAHTFSSVEILDGCRQMTSQLLLPFLDNEREFLRLINEEGRIEPSLISNDAAWNQRITSHPALIWKTRSVREHRGFSEAPED